MELQKQSVANSDQPLWLRIPQILRRYGISRSFFYKLVKERKLPQPFKPTPRVSLWLQPEMDAAFLQLRAKG